MSFFLADGTKCAQRICERTGLRECRVEDEGAVPGSEARRRVQRMPIANPPGHCSSKVTYSTNLHVNFGDVTERKTFARVCFGRDTLCISVLPSDTCPFSNMFSYTRLHVSKIVTFSGQFRNQRRRNERGTI